MVEMTRLNGHPFLVNADLIKHVEAIPDTTLTLVTGEKMVVLESCGEVLARTLTWRASLLREAWPTADTALLAHRAVRSAATTD
jgi:flagellar protein FlbD